MSRSKHTETQIIAALKQIEAGRSIEDVAREQGSVNTRSMPGRPSTDNTFVPDQDIDTVRAAHAYAAGEAEQDTCDTAGCVVYAEGNPRGNEFCDPFSYRD